MKVAPLLVFVLLAACVDNVEPPRRATSRLVCEGYELKGDLVKDLSTGLVWDRHVQQRFATHQEAVEICAARGARLPSRTELLALRDRSEGDACQLPACPFTGARCLTIQCGSKIPGTDDHWGVAMSGGALVGVPAGQAEALLCVRDPS